MTAMGDWNMGMYPWDFAECGHCLMMHLSNCMTEVRCHDPRHEHIRDVVTEQGIEGFYKARMADWDKYRNNYTPETDRWLEDNREKCVALRELFKDAYPFKKASNAQLELEFETTEAK